MSGNVDLKNYFPYSYTNRDYCYENSMLLALHKNIAFQSLFFLFFVHSLSNLLIEFVKFVINFSYLFIAWEYDFLKRVKKYFISFSIIRLILEVKRVMLLVFRCVEYVLFDLLTLSNFKSHAVLMI